MVGFRHVLPLSLSPYHLLLPLHPDFTLVLLTQSSQPKPEMSRKGNPSNRLKTTLWTVASSLPADSRQLECHLLFTCT